MVLLSDDVIDCNSNITLVMLVTGPEGPMTKDQLDLLLCPSLHKASSPPLREILAQRQLGLMVTLISAGRSHV